MCMFTWECGLHKSGKQCMAVEMRQNKLKIKPFSSTSSDSLNLCISVSKDFECFTIAATLFLMMLEMIYQLAKSHNTKRPNKQNVPQYTTSTIENVRLCKKRLHIPKRPTMQNVSLSAPTGLFNIAKEHPAAPLG